MQFSGENNKFFKAAIGPFFIAINLHSLELHSELRVRRSFSLKAKKRLFSFRFEAKKMCFFRFVRMQAKHLKKRK
jgi:hypothetical protein